MNSRERFRAVVQFETPDYYPVLSCIGIEGPVAETVWKWQREEGLPDWIGQRASEEELGIEWGSGMLASAQINRDWDRFWGMTRIHYWGPESRVERPEPEVLSENSEYRTIRHADGRTEREMHDNLHRYGMPEFIEYPLSEPEDWPAYRDRWVPIEDGVYPDNWDQIATRWRTRDFLLGMILPGTFSQLRHLFGTTRAATLFYDAPDTVHEILQHYRRRAFRMYSRFLAAVEPDYVAIGEDYCYRSGCLVSPATFREFFHPHYREEVALAREYGIPLVFVDSDGYVENIIPLLEEVGINGLEPFEPKSGPGNDVRRVRARHPNFIMRGGLDKLVMDQGDPAVIDAEIDAKVPCLLPLGGYFPTIDHGLPPTARYRSYLHFMRRLHEVTRNPEGEFWRYL